MLKICLPIKDHDLRKIKNQPMGIMSQYDLEFESEFTVSVSWI